MFENRINVVKKSLAQKQFNLMLAYNREKKYLKSFRVFILLLNKIDIFKLIKMYLYSILISIKKVLK